MHLLRADRCVHPGFRPIGRFLRHHIFAIIKSKVLRRTRSRRNAPCAGCRPVVRSHVSGEPGPPVCAAWTDAHLREAARRSTADRSTPMRGRRVHPAPGRRTSRVACARSVASAHLDRWRGSESGRRTALPPSRTGAGHPFVRPQVRSPSHAAPASAAVRASTLER